MFKFTVALVLCLCLSCLSNGCKSDVTQPLQSKTSKNYCGLEVPPFPCHDPPPEFCECLGLTLTELARNHPCREWDCDGNGVIDWQDWHGIDVVGNGDCPK